VTDAISFTLRPKPGAKPLDQETAARIARVAQAQTVELDDGGARFGLAAARGDSATLRGHLEMAARFELGAHWHTRYDVLDS
jgi:hypothetical protein